MRRGLKFFGIAIGVHLVLVLFGGLLFLRPDKEKKREKKIEIVDLVDDEQAKKEEKPEEEQKEPTEEIQEELEQAPDMSELVKTEATSTATPGLDAMSLSALESVLSGAAAGMGSDDFGGNYSLDSGGVIGGTGRARGGGDQMLDAAFSLADLDQKPRPLFQTAPTYPQDLRAKKIEGVVYILFLVDPAGKVVNPKVEKSTHEAFDRPALDAIRQWKFEPAIKSGQKVRCKMRVPIRFSL